jgi:hypothetical protein
MFKIVLNGGGPGIEKLAFTMSRECLAGMRRIAGKPRICAGFGGKGRALLGFA